MDKKEFLNGVEAGKLLGVSSRKFYDWVVAGKIKTYIHPVSNMKKYKRSEVEMLAIPIEQVAPDIVPLTEEFITAREAAQILNISTMSFYKYIKSGRIKVDTSKRVGKYRRFNKSEIQALLLEKKPRYSHVVVEPVK